MAWPAPGPLHHPERGWGDGLPARSRLLVPALTVGLGLVVASATLLLVPGATAHAGGGPTDPIESRIALPGWVVWSAGALVVALTFALVGGFLTRPEEPREDESLAVPPSIPATVTAGPGNVVGLTALVLLIAQPFVGDATSGFAEALVWVVVWAGLPLVAYTAGNPWPLISPFRALAALVQLTRGRGRAPTRAYPARLGHWPATALLLGLTALEVVGGPSHGEAGLALLAAAYAAWIGLGLVRWDAATLLARGEVFESVLAWWGCLAPVHRADGGLRAEWPGRVLEGTRAGGASGVALVIALLYGVNFDGFLATGLGRFIVGAGLWLGELGATVLLLVVGFAVFLAAFWMAAAAIRRASETLEPTARVAGRFAPALVPIAAGYHLAHNLVYLVQNAPWVAAAMADPLGLGWDPLGLAGRGAWAVPASWSTWLVAGQMLTILAGHALAVVVAHRIAFRSFPSRVQAIRSEGPLTFAMVVYTFVGLWTVSLAGAVASAGVTG